MLPKSPAILYVLMLLLNKSYRMTMIMKMMTTVKTVTVMMVIN